MMSLHNLETTVRYDKTLKIVGDEQEIELKQSVLEDHWTDPIVVRVDELQHIVEVAKALGWEGF
jgi:predicted component of type VI protein secretion system